jgi:dipeptidyl aminopeptidase/acylaminoacyl peptidase
MAQGDHSPLIPRDVLFGNPDRALVRLSPDGTQISYLAPLDGVLNVWVAPADDPAAATPVTRDADRGIRFYDWAYTNRHLVYLQDKGGDENWRVYRVDLETADTRDLTPLEGVQARLQEVSPKLPQEILVALNDRDPRHHDLYRIDIHGGDRRLVQENAGFAGFVTDDEYRVRFGLRVTPDGGKAMFRPSDGEPWTLFAHIPMEDSLTTTPIDFDATGRILYMMDSRDRDTGALVALDLHTGHQTTMASDPRADISGVMIHPTAKYVQAVAFTYEHKWWQALDLSVGEDLAVLRTVADGEVEVISRTLDDRTWIVAYILDDGPVRYYRYHRASREARFLFTNRQALDGWPLAKMHPVILPSREEMPLVSYLTLPGGSDGNGDGRPDHPVPLVLLVHGGPWARDYWGYHASHQWLANRGYAVLSVNFRGSTGFGKAFINASIREWGGRMHDDLIDAVHWAIREGIADPHRVAIMGGSYGGYATLIGLTFTPDTFACGVDIVGPSNLVTLLESIPPYWQPQVDLWATRVGDHRTPEGRAFLAERSPLTRADRIRRPLLIGQGANDPRVKQTESDQIVRAMQARGTPVTYVLYPDEGHGFARPENRLSFNAVAEAFLARCLGGRYQPIEDDFRGASLVVLVGADEVPGLTEALAARTANGQGSQ